MKLNRQFIAWLLIVGAVALVAFRNMQADTGKGEDLIQTATARFRTRLLIQMRAFQPSKQAEEKQITEQVAAVLRQMEREAQTPEQKFHAAIAGGEVIGKDRALSGLDKIGPIGDAELGADIAAARKIYGEGPQSLSNGERERLVKRHGEFGNLALAFGIPKSEEPRKSIAQSAFQSFVLSSMVVLGLLGVVMLSIVCCVVGGVLLMREKLGRAHVPASESIGPLVEAFAAYLLFFVAIGTIARLLGLQSIGWNWLVAVLVGGLLVWIKKTGHVQDAWRSLGLHPGRGWLEEIGFGIAAYIAGLVVIIPSVFITYFLVGRSGARVGHPIMAPLLTGGWREIAGLYGLACVLAPVTEELMFRGVLFSHLRTRWNWGVSAVIVSLIFASLHPQGWAAVPVLGAIALVLAAIREWRDSLVAPIAAHAFNNFIALTLTLLLLRL